MVSGGAAALSVDPEGMVRWIGLHLEESGDRVDLTPAAQQQLRSHLDGIGATPPLVPLVLELVRLAHHLKADERTRATGATLIDIAMATTPHLRALRLSRPADSERALAALESFASFQGQARALPAEVPPPDASAGQVRSGPMARFAMDKKRE